MYQNWPHHANSQRTALAFCSRLHPPKLLAITYLSVYGNAPLYLSELLHLYTPSRSLRSLSRSFLEVPRPRHYRKYGMASGPSGMLLPPSGMPCPRASGKLILFSLSRLYWKLTSLTKICSVMIWILAAAVMVMLLMCVHTCELAWTYV